MITLALYHIFCLIHPPVILQTDNGQEFSVTAISTKQHQLDWFNDGDGVDERMFESEISDDDLLSEVFTEIRKFWPKW